MIVTDWFWVILIAMGLNAFSYNLVSGTREALTYDSLLECGQEAGYLKVSSIQENLYLGIFALTNCMSVVTVALVISERISDCCGAGDFKLSGGSEAL